MELKNVEFTCDIFNVSHCRIPYSWSSFRFSISNTSDVFLRSEKLMQDENVCSINRKGMTRIRHKFMKQSLNMFSKIMNYLFEKRIDWDEVIERKTTTSTHCVLFSLLFLFEILLTFHNTNATYTLHVVAFDAILTTNIQSIRHF